MIPYGSRPVMGETQIKISSAQRMSEFSEQTQGLGRIWVAGWRYGDVSRSELS